MVKKTGSRDIAVVMGGSMAGLLAARVLSDHYREVILLERDKLPTSADQRRGVPQGRHTHGLLASGRQVLDRLFPGISRDLGRRARLRAISRAKAGGFSREAALNDSKAA